MIILSSWSLAKHSRPYFEHLYSIRALCTSAIFLPLKKCSHKYDNTISWTHHDVIFVFECCVSKYLVYDFINSQSITSQLKVTINSTVNSTLPNECNSQKAGLDEWFFKIGSSTRLTKIIANKLHLYRSRLQVPNNM